MDSITLCWTMPRCRLSITQNGKSKDGKTTLQYTHAAGPEGTPNPQILLQVRKRSIPCNLLLCDLPHQGWLAARTLLELFRYHVV